MDSIDTLLQHTETALAVTGKISVFTATIGGFIGACIGCNASYDQLNNSEITLTRLCTHVFGSYYGSGILSGIVIGVMYGFFAPVTIPVAIYRRFR